MTSTTLFELRRIYLMLLCIYINIFNSYLRLGLELLGLGLGLG